MDFKFFITVAKTGLESRPRTRLFLIPAMAAVLNSACGPTSNSDSQVRDTGVVDTRDSRTMVLYQSGDNVYLRTCQPPLAPPLNRDCQALGAVKSMRAKTYLRHLMLPTGPYRLDSAGLNLVTVALEDAEAAATAGNGLATATAERLRPIKTALKKIVEISDRLQRTATGLTYYEYQDDFALLLRPFHGDRNPGEGIAPLPGGMEFVKIPRGSFYMGTEGAGNERHVATISKAFFMQETEVTQSQWAEIVNNNPSTYTTSGSCPNEAEENMCPNNPVENVSFYDIQFFLQKMNQRRDGFVYRLPTEAEWEFAARGNSTDVFGVPGPTASFAWLNAHPTSTTHPVGRLNANFFGLYDMHGNVSEITNDWYAPLTDTAPQTDPIGPSSGTKRVVRGGDWADPPEKCHSASRTHALSDYRSKYLGFRLVRIPVPEK